MDSFLVTACAVGQGCAEGFQGVLGVVAGADGFGEAGGAFGLQSGEEDCGLDLGRWDGRGEVDGVERTAVDSDGRMSIHQIDLRSHFAERFADALHWTEGKGVVADEGEGVRMGGDEAREHAHGRAGVAAIERDGRLAEGSGYSGDFDDCRWACTCLDDRCAKGFHAGERRVRVGSGGEVREPRRAFRQPGQHGVAVRDGLVAGDGERTLQRAGGADDLGGHSLSSVAALRAVLDASRHFVLFSTLGETRDCRLNLFLGCGGVEGDGGCGWVEGVWWRNGSAAVAGLRVSGSPRRARGRLFDSLRCSSLRMTVLWKGSRITAALSLVAASRPNGVRTGHPVLSGIRWVGAAASPPMTMGLS